MPAGIIVVYIQICVGVTCLDGIGLAPFYVTDDMGQARHTNTKEGIRRENT